MSNIELLPKEIREKCKIGNKAISETLTLAEAADDCNESNANFSKGNGPLIKLVKLMCKIRMRELTRQVSTAKSNYAIESIYEVLDSVSGRRSFVPIVHHTDTHDMLSSSTQTMKRASIMVEKMMDAIDPKSEFGEQLSENEEIELLHLNSLLQQLTYGIEDLIKRNQAERNRKGLNDATI